MLFYSVLFFFHTPENNNDIHLPFDPDNPKVRELKALLDAHEASDVNDSVTSNSGESYTKKHPHYPGRMDQQLFHDEEAAAIPEGYHIDLA